MGSYQRRRFLVATGALLAVGAGARCVGAIAQPLQAARPRRIVLSIAWTEEIRQAWIDLLSGLGWAYERDYLLFDSGLPYGPEIDKAAKRILEQKPDLIIALSSSYALALHRLTRTTPIVMLTSGYPVAAGLAHSLARPGMNITGNSAYAGTGVWGKLFQLLQEAKSGVRRVGLLWDYLPPTFLHEEIEFGMQQLRADARSLGVETEFAEVRRPEEALAGLNALVSKGVHALVVSRGPVLFPQFARMMELATAAGLPTITDIAVPESIATEPLLAYGPDWSELWRQTAAYVDRIFRGAAPGDLPIQHPARFQLVVSTKTAKALGLALPPSLLLRADRVIE